MRKRSRVWAAARRLQRPRVSLVLLGVIVADAALAGPGMEESTIAGHVVGQVVWAAAGWRYVEDRREVDRTYLVVNSQGTDEIVEGSPPPGAALVAFVVHTDRTTSRGVWALVEETREESLRLWGSMGRTMTPARVRLAFARSHPERSYLGAADRVTTRVLWEGWAHTAVAGAAAGLLLWSLGWLLAPVRVWLESRRLRAGLCPKCWYNLSGLSDGAGCPECGWGRA